MHLAPSFIHTLNMGRISVKVVPNLNYPVVSLLFEASFLEEIPLAGQPLPQRSIFLSVITDIAVTILT